MLKGQYVTAVLLAAGKGERMEGGPPKQYADVGGEQMYFRSLRTLISSELVDALVLVVPSVGPPSPVPIEAMGFTKLRAMVEGGDTRQVSLFRGVRSAPKQTDIVLVHDAARPLLQRWLVDRVLNALDESCDCVIPAVAMGDAVKRVSGERFVTESLSKKGIWRAQTPQASRIGAMKQALKSAEQSGLEAEDCSELLAAAGFRVKAVDGDPMNMKVTRREDLDLVRTLVAARPPLRNRRRTAFPGIRQHRR